jgi:hypothetical protein
MNSPLTDDEFLSLSSAKMFLRPEDSHYIFKVKNCNKSDFGIDNLPDLGFCYQVLSTDEENLERMLKVLETLKMPLLDVGKQVWGKFKKEFHSFTFYPYADMN